jgi:hypothetical protein
LAAFIVILAIVAHRFLRLDLINDFIGRAPIRSVLMGMLALALAQGILSRSVRLRMGIHMILQWLLWAWAGVTALISDGTGKILPYIKDDYAKDLIFATLVSTLCDTLRRLRWLSWTVVAVMTFIACVALPQRNGTHKCYHYPPNPSLLNYTQETDNRLCMAAADCFDVPPSEEHLRNEYWACEREGVWGLATVLDRIHYVGNLMDPNGLALALVMASALALGLLTWPAPAPSGSAPSSPGSGPAPGASYAAGRVGRLLLLAALGTMGLAVIFAASRAGQIALALVVVAFAYSRIGIGGVALAGVAVTPVVFISTRNAAEAAYSTLTRVQTQLNGYQAFLDHPVFGVGFGNYGQISFITAHNSLLLAATETGFLGSALYVLSIYTIFKFLIQVLRWVPTLEGEEPPESLPDLKHFARTLIIMMGGVLLCVSFLSMTFDVMWLFPVAIVAAFYNVVLRELPDFELSLSGVEILGALICGALAPVVLAALLA